MQNDLAEGGFLRTWKVFDFYKGDNFFHYAYLKLTLNNLNKTNTWGKCGKSIA